MLSLDKEFPFDFVNSMDRGFTVQSFSAYIFISITLLLSVWTKTILPTVNYDIVLLWDFSELSSLNSHLTSVKSNSSDQQQSE